MFGRTSHSPRENRIDKLREGRHRGPPSAAAATGRCVVQTGSSGVLPASLRRGNGTGSSRPNNERKLLGVGKKSVLRTALQSEERPRQKEDGDSGSSQRRESTPPSCDLPETSELRRYSPVSQPSSMRQHPAGLGLVERRQQRSNMDDQQLESRLSGTTNMSSATDTTRHVDHKYSQSRSATNASTAVYARTAIRATNYGSSSNGSRKGRSSNQADDAVSSVRHGPIPSSRANSSPSGSPYLETASQYNTCVVHRGRFATLTNSYRIGGKTPREHCLRGSGAGGDRNRSNTINRESQDSHHIVPQAPPSTAPSSLQISHLPLIDGLDICERHSVNNTERVDCTRVRRLGDEVMSTVPSKSMQNRGESHNISRVSVTRQGQVPSPCGGSVAVVTTSTGGINDKSSIGSKPRRLVGVGSAGMAPGNEASPHLVGLQNLGNTCFMNACLQCLLHTDVLVDFFRQGKHKQQICLKSPTQGALAIAFGELVRQVEVSPAYSSVSPAQVKKLISRHASHFSGYGQQDCQEFLRYFLDGLAEDLNRRGRGEASVTASKTLASPTPSILSEETLSRLPADQQADRAWATHLARNDSEISSIFSGQLQSRISCQTCGNESYCFDPFFDLSVPLTGARGSRLASGGSHGVGGTGEYSDEDHQKNGDHISRSSVEGMHHGTVECALEDCLRAFTKEEPLDGDNRPICSGCRRRRKSVKSLAVHRFPPVLVIHLKRFQCDSSSREKLGTVVDFPTAGLDLEPYSTPLARPSDQNHGGRDSLDVSGETGSTPLKVAGTCGITSSSVRAEDKQRADRPRYNEKILPVYDLYGICNHMGSLEGGHYTAHCRGRPSGEDDSSLGRWNTFDDARVSRMNMGKVEGGAAYVLFYRLAR